MKSQCWGWLLLLPLLVSIAAPGDTAQGRTTRYRVTDLGTLGGDRSYAIDLNDRGQVVGFSDLEPGRFDQVHAFLWEKGRLRDLGTLGGESSAAYAINRHGYVVGSADTAGGTELAVLWKNGAIRDLGTLPGGAGSSASDINDRGEIVGAGDTFVANRFGFFEVNRGFLWKNGRMRMLDDLDSRAGPEEGSSNAFAINNRGVVVGIADRTNSDSSWPVLWQTGASHRVNPVARQEGWAYALNDAGQVVGRLVRPDGFPQMEAYTWKNGRPQKLPLLTPDSESVAFGINRRGQIVGRSDTPTDQRSAVLWFGGAVTDLNDLIPDDSGWVLEDATAINRSGQIVGTGQHDGAEHAYLLTPK